MELGAAQKKIVQSKPFGFSLIKGNKFTGKTIAGIYRSIHLKNNFCLYDEDNILFLTGNKNNLESLKEKYNDNKEKAKFDYLSLFSNFEEKVYISSLEDIINEQLGSEFKVLEDPSEILKECFNEMKIKYSKSKIFKEEYIGFLKEEITWIKSCSYTTLESYQNCDRIGRKCNKLQGPQRLLKNSNTREEIFCFLELYNIKLKEKGCMDKEDLRINLLNHLKRASKGKYTHILVDEAEFLTKVEFDIIKELSKSKAYSSIMLIMDVNKTNPYSWFIKGRKNNSLGFTAMVRSYTLNKIYYCNQEEETMNKEELNTHNEKFLENYQYVDMKHNRKVEFFLEEGSSKEIIVKENEENIIFKEEELETIPVYSDIAAGEPIPMSTLVEDNFPIPSQWIKGMKECFMLKVKGDSMKNADINDGDYVVVRKQYNAQNREIVAVDIDGSATLKRLSLGKGTAVLLPENPKYSPINLYGTEARILGVVVGVLKQKNS